MKQFAMQVVLVYAIILAIGGVVGYRTAKSTASLLTGLATGTILLAGWFFGRDPGNMSAGLGVATLFSGFLLIFFAIRFARTKKVMPTGIMLFISLVVTFIFALALLER